MMFYVNVRIYLATLCLYVLQVAAVITDKRVAAKLFSNSTYIQGRHIACDNVPESNPPQVFVSDVWTCNNIRVGDMRLEYETGFGHTYGQTDSEVDSNKVKDDFNGKSDIAELCRVMLHAHGILTDLWAAYASDITFEAASHPRLILILTKVENQTLHTWQETESRKSYIGSIQCMVMDE